MKTNLKAFFIPAFGTVLAGIIMTVSLSVSSQDFRIKSSDFKSIYNDYRVRQPKNVPWAGSYWAYGTNGIAIKLADGKSPAGEYDALFNSTSEAWEKENHSCDQYTGETKKGCESWWGHCNAWSSAGIKELEPRAPLTYRGKTLSVGDQKAWITELWMDSGSLFTGRTNKSVKTGAWVKDSNSSTARERLDYGTGNNYDAFWDVSPRQMFLIFTNYVGLLEQGVVIDRFTGEEVWNQPIVGYRILPIKESDVLAPETRGRSTLYPVRVQMKIYWAHDGVAEEHVTKPFDINRTGDSEWVENFGEDYDGRYLAFKLFFDEPLIMDNGKVSSVGKIVGDGIWAHQEKPPHSLDELNKGHPDFIWAPLELEQYASNSNPFIREANVRAALDGRSSGPVETADSPMPPKRTLKFSKTSFEGLEGPEAIKDQIKFVLNREGIRTVIYLSGVEEHDSEVHVEIKLISGGTWQRVETVLSEAGFSAL